MKLNYVLNKIYHISHDFGLVFAIKVFFYKLVDELNGYKYTKLFFRFMRKFCKNLIKEAIQCDELFIEASDVDDKALIPVWCFWAQGERKLPEVVKICVASQRKYFIDKKYSYHFLSMQNIDSYIKIPSIYYERLNNNELSYTHFSDILRVELLKEYGGIWIDASFYMSGNRISDDMLMLPIFSLKRKSLIDDAYKNASNGKWVVGFLYAQKRYKLFIILSKVYEIYWKRYHTLIDYFLLDHIIAACYSMFPDIKDDIDSIPYNNILFRKLSEVINDPYDDKKYKLITEDTFIHTLTWKREYIKNNWNRKTFWNYLCEKQ